MSTSLSLSLSHLYLFLCYYHKEMWRVHVWVCDGHIKRAWLMGVAYQERLLPLALMVMEVAACRDQEQKLQQWVQREPEHSPCLKCRKNSSNQISKLDKHVSRINLCACLPAGNALFCPVYLRSLMGTSMV